MNSNAVQSYTQALLRCYPDNTFPCDKYLLNRESETVEFYVTEFYDDYEPVTRE